jgi:hypothetical protein
MPAWWSQSTISSTRLVEEIVDCDHHGEGNGDDLREVAAYRLCGRSREIQKIEFSHGSFNARRLAQKPGEADSLLKPQLRARGKRSGAVQSREAAAA